MFDSTFLKKEKVFFPLIKSSCEKEKRTVDGCFSTGNSILEVEWPIIIPDLGCLLACHDSCLCGMCVCCDGHVTVGYANRNSSS